MNALLPVSQSQGQSTLRFRWDGSQPRYAGYGSVLARNSEMCSGLCAFFVISAQARRAVTGSRDRP